MSPLQASIPSGFGGERGIVQLAPDRILFSSGRVGTGRGSDIGRGEAERALGRVQRSAGGWSVCGLDGIDRSYFGRGLGRLLCLEIEDGSGRSNERLLGDGRFEAPIDLTASDRNLVIARDDQAHLTVFRFVLNGEAEGWRLPDPSNSRAGFILDQDHVAALHPDGGGCALRVFRLLPNGSTEVTQKEADPRLCQFRQFEVLRDIRGAGVWLYAWDARQAALYDIADGVPVLVDNVRLSRRDIGPGPIAVVDGVIYFDAGVGPHRGSLIGVFDPRTRSRTTVPAHPHSQLEGPPSLLGLMPSMDGTVEVLVRNGDWATYPFDTVKQ